MNRFMDHELVEAALRDAAWVAKHGSREEKSGRFLPPKPAAPESARKPKGPEAA